MTRAKSLFWMGMAAVAIGYSAHSYTSHFSNERIWTRLHPAIERIRASGDVNAVKKLRYAELKTTLAALTRKRASSEERCRCEKDFSLELATGSKDAAAEAVYRQTYEPYADCKPINQLINAPATLIVGLAGIFVFLGSLYGLARSFVRKAPRASFKDC